MHPPCVEEARFRRASFEFSFLVHRSGKELFRRLMDLLGLFDQLHALFMARKVKVAEPLVLANVEEQGGLLFVAIEKSGQVYSCQVDDGEAIWKWLWVEI